MLKPKYIRVIEALEKGLEVKLMNQRVVLNKESELCMVVTHPEYGEAFMALDWTFNHFVKLCQQLEDKDIPFL